MKSGLESREFVFEVKSINIRRHQRTHARIHLPFPCTSVHFSTLTVVTEQQFAFLSHNQSIREYNIQCKTFPCQLLVSLSSKVTLCKTICNAVVVGFSILSVLVIRDKDLQGCQY